MNPFSLLEELLRFRRVKSEETADLSGYSHDDLCRAIEDNIHVLLNSFEKYKHIAYLVQGPRDQGVDVLLKGTPSESEGQTFIGLQVKSFEELQDRSNQLSKQLKAGFVDAMNHYGDSLERYYILLFGDAKKHEKRISAITAEFAKWDKVRVVGPRHLLAFLRLPESTIGAVVDRHLGEEDYVRKLARSEASEYTTPELHFFLACICWALENSSDVLPFDFFTDEARLDDLRERYGDEFLADCFDRFADSDFEVHAEPATTRLRLEHFPAIQALYFDLKVRYEETDDELFDHLLEFLRIEDDSADGGMSS